MAICKLPKSDPWLPAFGAYLTDSIWGDQRIGVYSKAAFGKTMTAGSAHLSSRPHQDTGTFGLASLATLLDSELLNLNKEMCDPLDYSESISGPNISLFYG